MVDCLATIFTSISKSLMFRVAIFLLPKSNASCFSEFLVRHEPVLLALVTYEVYRIWQEGFIKLTALATNSQLILALAHPRECGEVSCFGSFSIPKRPCSQSKIKVVL